jgi:hypothetical protein
LALPTSNNFEEQINSRTKAISERVHIEVSYLFSLLLLLKLVYCLIDILKGRFVDINDGPAVLPDI